MATTVITMKLLGRGPHTSPRSGANVLELASVLAGERWSDRPPSVHPALAVAAGAVNDLMSDDRRRLLGPLAPWLLGTNISDPRVWPGVTSVCIQAGMPAGGQDRARLLADLDHARNWLADASAGCAGRPGQRASRRDRRWAMRAIVSGLRSVPDSADPQVADARLCRALTRCINECRQLAGECAVDPLLSLADCPRQLRVEPHAVWSPGCDWMEFGYQLVPKPLPVGREHAAAAQPAGSAASHPPMRS